MADATKAEFRAILEKYMMIDFGFGGIQKAQKEARIISKKERLVLKRVTGEKAAGVVGRIIQSNGKTFRIWARLALIHLSGRHPRALWSPFSRIHWTSIFFSYHHTHVLTPYGEADRRPRGPDFAVRALEGGTEKERARLRRRSPHHDNLLLAAGEMSR